MTNDSLKATETNASTAATEDRGFRAILTRHPWLPFVLPWAVYMVLGTLEPRPAASDAATGWLSIDYRFYPIVYSVKILGTLGAMLWMLPDYKKFPLRVSFWAPLVGLVGIGVWVGLCAIHLEQRCLPAMHLGWLVELGRRDAYDPFREMATLSPWCARSFLCIRFFGLVVVVPLIEEFFLRGFLMPQCIGADWRRIPFGAVNREALLLSIAYGILTHPAELVAAAAWFALVTWLMARTRNIWDCVVAHALTNLFLGVYVVASGDWQLL